MGDAIGLMAADSAIWAAALACLFAGVLVELGMAAIIDARTFRIPNKLVIALGITWLSCACCYKGWLMMLGSACTTLGFVDMSATVMPGIVRPIEGLLSGTVILFAGFAFSLAYEKGTGRFSMGGGDIKLLAVVALFVCWERLLVMLMVACVAFVAWSLLWPKLSLLLRETKASESSHISRKVVATVRHPFGPFICLSCIAVVVGGIVLG